MKYLPLYIVFLLGSRHCLSQNTEEEKGRIGLDSRIQVELITETDTLDGNKPFPLSIRISNKSKKPVYIPKEIDVVSNLYPNGRNEIWDGAVIHLKINPIPQWASIHQENTLYIESVEFIKIKPNASAELPFVDLKSHIESFNERMNSKDLKVHGGKIHKLQITYINNREKNGKEKRTFIGEAKSSEKEIYVE